MPGKLIPRERLLERIRPVYDSDIIKVLMGPRGSGKSVILSMIADEIDAEEDHKIFINFEDMKYDYLRTICSSTRSRTWKISHASSHRSNPPGGAPYS